jgi:hypothetical protein
MSDEQFEISSQLRIRASRMCCDGYYEFDAKLDVEAADEIERLRGIRENLNRYMPTARLDLVDEERCCSECQGSGIKTYATSATWRGGSGGMTLTTDVCNTCWGSGDANRPWPSHREIERLRAALAKITAGRYDGLEVTHYSAHECRNIARAALIKTP